MKHLIEWAVGLVFNGLFGTMLNLIGLILLKAIAIPLMTYVVIPLLKLTLFNPVTLTGSSVVGQAAGWFWRFSAAASGAVALLGLTWGWFLSLITSAGEHPRDPRAFLDAGIIYGLVLFGGYLFLRTLLGIANNVTTALVNQSFTVAAFNTNHATGVAVGLIGGLSALLYPASILVAAGAILYAVVVWIMRQVDLIFYVGMLPLTAALMFTGNRKAFDWNWNEAVGAVLSQLAMVLVWFVALKVMTSGGRSFFPLPPTAAHPAAFGRELMTTLLGIGLLLMVSKAPQLLQNVTGHQTAGVMGMAVGMAVGSMAARGARTAIGMTPAGQAVEQAVKGRQEKAKETVAGWGDRKSLGEKVAGSNTGKRVSAAAHGLSERVSESRPAQAARAAVGSARAGLERMQEWGDEAAGGVPGDVLRAVGGAIGGSARIAGDVTKGAAGIVRTTGSMAYQPRATLGQMARRAQGQGALSAYNAETAQMRSEVDTVGLETAARRRGMKPEDLQARIDAPHDAAQALAVRYAGETSRLQAGVSAIGEEPMAYTERMKPEALRRRLDYPDAPFTGGDGPRGGGSGRGGGGGGGDPGGGQPSGGGQSGGSVAKPGSADGPPPLGDADAPGPSFEERRAAVPDGGRWPKGPPSELGVPDLADLVPPKPGSVTGDPNRDSLLRSAPAGIMGSRLSPEAQRRADRSRRGRQGAVSERPPERWD